MFSEKILNFIPAINKQFFIFMNKNKIIGIADVSFDPQFIFDELIQFVHVDIGEQLRGQIAEWQSGTETLDYFPKKIHEPIVLGSFWKNIKKDFMIYGIEKFSYVQFQNPQSAGVIMRQTQSQILQSSHRRMRALCFSGRPRVENKCFIPYRFNDPVDGMMEKPIANRGLMDMAAFRIVNEKGEITAVFVGPVFEIVMQRKNVVFEINLEFRHVVFVGLFLLEFRPSVEQVLQRNYFIKHKYGK